MNKQDIADRYARRNGFDKAELCAVRDGVAYFHLMWEPRPKYSGHPNVIRISPTGKILVVTDMEEKYWAIGQPKEALPQP